ncbi:hypothetical protein BaRGS_00016428, partial [Batillaria attramentaria]
GLAITHSSSKRRLHQNADLASGEEGRLLPKPHSETHAPSERPQTILTWSRAHTQAHAQTGCKGVHTPEEWPFLKTRSGTSKERFRVFMLKLQKRKELHEPKVFK